MTVSLGKLKHKEGLLLRTASLGNPSWGEERAHVVNGVVFIIRWASTNKGKYICVGETPGPLRPTLDELRVLCILIRIGGRDNGK